MGTFECGQHPWSRSTARFLGEKSQVLTKVHDFQQKKSFAHHKNRSKSSSQLITHGERIWAHFQCGKSSISTLAHGFWVQNRAKLC